MLTISPSWCVVIATPELYNYLASFLSTRRLTFQKLSASSAALDLALSQKSRAQESQHNGGGSWGGFRHRPAQHSLPVNNYPYTPASKASPKVTVPQTDSPTSFRRYEEKSFPQFSENLEAKLAQSSEISHANQNARLQSSFSSSDIPTMRAANHNVNAQNFGRIQMDRSRHSREPSASGEMLNSVPASKLNIQTCPCS